MGKGRGGPSIVQGRALQAGGGGGGGLGKGLAAMQPACMPVNSARLRVIHQHGVVGGVGKQPGIAPVQGVCAPVAAGRHVV